MVIYNISVFIFKRYFWISIFGIYLCSLKKFNIFLFKYIYNLIIPNCLCNQYLSPLMWVRISIRARCITLCDKVCQWLPPVSSTNKTDRHDIAEILLKVALKTIKPTNKFDSSNNSLNSSHVNTDSMNITWL